MRHAHAVGLVQDVVGQVVALVARTGSGSGSPPSAEVQLGDERAQRRFRAVPGQMRRFCAGENVPFQKKCASSRIEQRAFEQALQLVLEADLVVGDGQRDPAARADAAQSTPGVSAERARARRSALIGEIAAEQLVRAFAATAPRSRGCGSFEREPDRQRAGVRAGLVGVVGELLDGAREIHVRIQIELVVVGAIDARATSRKYGLSSKLRPAKRDGERLEALSARLRRVVQDGGGIQAAAEPRRPAARQRPGARARNRAAAGRAPLRLSASVHARAGPRHRSCQYGSMRTSPPRHSSRCPGRQLLDSLDQRAGPGM